MPIHPASRASNRAPRARVNSLIEKTLDLEGLEHALVEQPGARVRRDELLRGHCTFRVGGPADLFVEVDTVEALQATLVGCRREGVPFHLLGLGSNVLFPDEGLRGATVRLAGTFRETRFEGTEVVSGAAVSLPQLARDTASNGLVGLEALCGFPSTVGGAVFMNAGCYGTEIKDVLVHADVLELDGAPRRLLVGDLEARYRATNLSKTGAIVTSARFALTEGDAAEAVARLDDFNRKRWKSLPSGKPNVGSIFKNPEGDAAGRLIDVCDLKGRTRGGAQISEKHGNVILNQDGASAQDILELMLEAYYAVLEKFEVRLEPEVILCGSLGRAWRDEVGTR